MFGWDELLLIAVIALVVIGPKDLPAVLRTLGRWVRRLRMMAAQAQSQVDDLIREAELDDLRRQMNSARPTELARRLDRSIDPDGTIAETFRKSPRTMMSRATTNEDRPDPPSSKD